MLGVAYAVPAAVVTPFAPLIGLSLAVGVLPAAALGLGESRRRRARVVLVGAVAGLSVFLGSLIAPTPVLAVLVIFASCVVVAVAVSDPAHRLAPLIMMLGLPLLGAGLSVDEPATAAAAGLLMVLGSVYAWGISMLWPEQPGPAARPRAATVSRGR